MRVASLLGLAAFMLTSLVVGLRVFWLWRSTRKLPELLLSVALLSTGFLAYAVATAGKLFVTGSIPLKETLTLAGLAVECTGIAALVAFAFFVFHPRERWAKLAMAALLVAIGAALVAEVTSGEFLRYADSRPISGPWVPLGLVARSSGPVWMSYECFRYWRKLKRQAALGLAAPLVVNRVLLWGLGIGASAVGYAISVAHRLVYGTGLKAHDWALASVSSCALVASFCIGFAFFPPAAYRRWVQSRGGNAAGETT